jgi:hypothetical protein
MAGWLPQAMDGLPLQFDINTTKQTAVNPFIHWDPDVENGKQACYFTTI